MSIQLAVSTRNTRLDDLETDLGTSPIFRIRTGSQPANCAAADSGSVLAELTLPSDWLAAASSGTKAKSGTWSATATGTGTAAHFRIYTSGGVCKFQGSVGAGSGDLSLDSVSITSGQLVTIDTFTLTDGNP